MTSQNNLKPAILGGKPVRTNFLPYGAQDISREDIRAVTQVLKSKFLTTGPKVKAFEEKMAEVVGAKYAVSFSSGTAALHGAMAATGVEQGDEVITTPITFCSTANAILFQQAYPVFADVKPASLNLDPHSVLSKISPKTKAILPVHFAGNPVEMAKFEAIAKQYKLALIYDACHALGAGYQNRPIANSRTISVFSFHPVKSICAGEGGMVTTQSKSQYNKLIAFRNHGIHPKIAAFQGILSHRYGMTSLGNNYRLSDIHCALGLSQIRRLDSFIKKRNQLANQYIRRLKSCHYVTPLTQNPDGASAHHIFVVRLNLALLKTGRKKIFDALKAEGIGVNIHYLPVYYHPYYQNELKYKKGLCPNAESAYRQIITLPLFYRMTNNDIKDVCTALTKVCEYYAK